VSPHVAVLRGVNVGGRNRLPMAELARMFETAGAVRVETLIQSGNVIFEANEADAGGIAETVGAAIVGACGFKAPIVLRDARSWGEMLAANPFLAGGVAAGELHVALLSAPVPAARLARLRADRSPPDAFTATATAIYLHLPNGVARTKLSNSWLDAELGIVSTMRNWATVTRLAQRLAARI
jgi:uncharacterized protein (DUF1697 family)